MESFTTAANGNGHQGGGVNNEYVPGKKITLLHNVRIRSVEERTAILEESQEISDGQLNKLAHDLKVLIAEFTIMNKWIKFHFGIQLIDEDSTFHKSINQDSREINEIIANVALNPQASADSENIANPLDAPEHLQVDHQNQQMNTTEAHVIDLESEEVEVKIPIRSEANTIIVTPTITTNVSASPRDEPMTHGYDRVQSVVEDPSPNIPRLEPAEHEFRPASSPSNNTTTVTEDLFTCSHCNIPFSSQRTLATHLRTHTTDKPYRCHMCHRGFNFKHILARHMRIHNSTGGRNRRYLCNYCHASLASKNNLKAHLRTHTGEKPYVCTWKLCGWKFARSDELKMHIRTHTGEKLHVCTFCDRSFSRNNVLQEHIRSHTGDRPFKCDICDEAFTRRALFRKHIQKHRSTTTDKGGQAGETDDDEVQILPN